MRSDTRKFNEIEWVTLVHLHAPLQKRNKGRSQPFGASSFSIFDYSIEHDESKMYS